MIQDVGFDNLPNSYISLIEISEFSSLMNVVHTHFILKDVKKDGLFSWYNRDELGKYLKLLVVASNVSSINEALDNGSMPLDKTKISAHPDFDRTLVQFREINVGWDKSQMLIDGEPTTQGEMFEFEFGDRFYIRNTHKDLKVYCATYIDTKQYAQDYKLDLSHSTISSYTGPVASEAVFNNGKVVRHSFVFRTAQRAIWSGPVRFIDGVYYSGSHGGARPSEALTRLRVPNLKIKDYRKRKLIAIEQSHVDDKLPPFPDPAFSYNPDGSLSTLFSVDLRALLLKRSKLAKRLAIIDESLLQKIIQKIQIDKLILRKQKIITRQTNSRAGTRIRSKKATLHSKIMANTKDSAPYNLIPAESENSKLEEIVVTTNPNIRHFALRDYNNSKSKGEYGYVLEIEFEDPVKSYVDILAATVEKNLSNLKYYVERSQMPKNQNSSRTRFIDAFVQKELTRFGDQQQPWNVAAKLFSTYYSMFLDLNRADAKEIAESVVSKIHPSFATPLSVNHFIKEYSDLHQHFVRFMNPKTKRLSNLKGRTTKGKSSSENKINAKKVYKDIIMHEERDNAIVYYDFKEDVYPIITVKEYISRNQKEEEKFFNSKPSLAGTNLSKISKKAAEKLTIDASKITGFLTPSRIKARKMNVDLSEPSSVDLAAFNKVFMKANKKKEPNKPDEQVKKKAKLIIKTAKKIDKYLKPPIKETKTIEENVGKTSKFKPAQDSFKPVITSKVASVIKTKLKKKNKKKVSAKQFAADSNKIKRLVKNIDKVRLPPSLISVVASESDTIKNNTLTAPTDLASNPETKDFFAIMYTNPVQIETIQGYRKDARGREIYSDPIWELLDEKDFDTTEPIICRFRVFNTMAFETQGFDMNIANEFFILQPESKITKSFNIKEIISMQQIVDIIEETEQRNIEYQMSNIVKQSIDKNGPLR